jgi:hypothetical protein
MTISTRFRAVLAGVGAFVAATAATPAHAQCEPRWTPLFGEAPGTNGSIETSIVFDDGTGPALYVAGEFTRAGGIVANRIAKWDGVRWSPLGSGMDIQTVNCLAVFDDGDGPALYAGGSFAQAGDVQVNGIARWDGSAWHPVGFGDTVGVSGFVHSMAVFDDGTGPALYVGGFFSAAGGVPAMRIAKWDGQNWSAVGQGMSGGAGGQVRALQVWDDGTGPALYAAGSFLEADGAVVNRIAKWTGTAWVGLGGGMNTHIWDLEVWDDGSGAGPCLYAAGEFITAGGVTVNRIARWDGSTWTPLGTGMNGVVRALTVFDDAGPGGPALIAAGDFTSAGGVTVNRIAKWDGTSWSPFTAGANGPLKTLAVYDDGSGAGPALHAAGSFVGVGLGGVMDNIVKWNETRDAWDPLGRGLGNAVLALEIHDDGAGPAMYAAGRFVTAHGTPLLRAAKWNGPDVGWTGLGGGVTGGTVIYDLQSFDDGSGPALFAVGDFTTIGGNSISRVAKWDGSSWLPLGSGVNSVAYALAVYDDGSGPALYVAGQFVTAGGITVNRIAKWDGAAWSPLGPPDNPGVNNTISVMTVFDDGAGPALYVAGAFTAAGSVPAMRIAKWDGQNWSPLGGEGAGLDRLVESLCVYDDGDGPALYVGGDFSFAGGVPARHIAKWDGVSWSSVGGGMNHVVSAMAVYDDGSGPALFCGGVFTEAGGQPANYIAKWDGSTWTNLGEDTSGIVSALLVFDDGLGDGDGPALFVGGSFIAQPGGDSYIARYQGCAGGACPADWNGDGQINSTDISAFLTAWLASINDGTLDADFNADGAVNSTDISAFLTAWLQALQTGC